MKDFVILKKSKGTKKDEKEDKKKEQWNGEVKGHLRSEVVRRIQDGKLGRLYS